MTWGIGAAWLGVVLAGTFLMMAYANTPSEAGAPPVNWPDSSQLAHNREKPTLVMFLHPKCPCSRATVGELALLMAHCQGRVETHVFFLRPAGKTVEWAQSDLWQEAALIPGVTIHRDDEGREAQHFNAATSGETVLYDARGRLQFHGGITTARGHSGDNAGRDALQDLLLQMPVSQTVTPVYGCSLFGCPAKDAPSGQTNAL